MASSCVRNKLLPHDSLVAIRPLSVGARREAAPPEGFYKDCRESPELSRARIGRQLPWRYSEAIMQPKGSGPLLVRPLENPTPWIHPYRNGDSFYPAEDNCVSPVVASGQPSGGSQEAEAECWLITFFFFPSTIADNQPLPLGSDRSGCWGSLIHSRFGRHACNGICCLRYRKC